MFPKFNPRAGAGVLLVTAIAALSAGCGSDNNSSTSSGTSTGAAAASGDKGGKIAFLLPENKTARYENQDKPFFEAKVKELCPSCQVIYQNATQVAA